MDDCIPVDGLHEWTVRVLLACGVMTAHAESTARVLLASDLQGIDSHGIARLPAYVRRLRLGLVALEGEPEVIASTAATARVDGHNLLGPPVGEFAMAAAIDRARDAGVGWVTATNSNHYGIAGWYPRMAIAEGLIGLSGSSAPSLVAPAGSATKHLGTNPIAVGAPSADGRPLLFDMATSAAAGGKFEIAIREGSAIPEGWGLNADGVDTTRPGEVFGGGGSLLPLGSFPWLGYHKGFGLALVVEVLSAALSGSPSGPEIGALTSASPTGPAGVSHFFVALDPKAFGVETTFARDVASMGQRLRDLPPRDPSAPVRIPGDRSFTAIDERQARGVPLQPPVVESLVSLGADVGEPFPSSATGG